MAAAQQPGSVLAEGCGSILTCGHPMVERNPLRRLFRLAQVMEVPCPALVALDLHVVMICAQSPFLVRRAGLNCAQDST